MSVYAAFSPSTLGMLSQTHALRTISTNISNVTTGGYKASETRFQTVFSEQMFEQSDLGGVKPFDIQYVTKQGLLLASERDLDLGINGQGFFNLATNFDLSGETLYGRDGTFKMRTVNDISVTADDGNTITVKDGYLADKNNYFVLGWEPLADGTFPTSDGTLVPLRIDAYAFSNDFDPTTTANLDVNLAANAAEGDTDTYGVSMVDSAGAEQTVTFNFTKTSTINQWDLSTITSRDPVAQVDTVTLGGTVEAGDTYSVTVDGTIVSYPVTGGEADLDAIRDNLVTAINSDPSVGAQVTAAAGGSGVITLTADTAGSPFTTTTAATQGVADVAQIDTVTITAGGTDAGDQYRVSVNGIDYTVTLVGGETLAQVRTALIAAVTADPNVTAGAGAGAGDITITADTAGTPFTSAVSLPVDANGDNTIAVANTVANVTAANDNTAAVATTTANGTNSVTTAIATLVFDGKGQIVSPTSATLPLTWAGGTTATVTLDTSGMTQFAGGFLPFHYSDNGLPTSLIKNITFDQVGHVIGTFEDGSSRLLYKIPLAEFINANGLHERNGNVYAETQNSGSASTVAAAERGYALFVPNSRELSNVDLADEYTTMIMTQNAYNANATTFKTVDEMVEVARDLKR